MIRLRRIRSNLGGRRANDSRARERSGKELQRGERDPTPRVLCAVSSEVTLERGIGRERILRIELKSSFTSSSGRAGGIQTKLDCWSRWFGLVGKSEEQKSNLTRSRDSSSASCLSFSGPNFPSLPELRTTSLDHSDTTCPIDFLDSCATSQTPHPRAGSFRTSRALALLLDNLGTRDTAVSTKSN